ncbi:MAG: lactate utilization protein B, partial [Halobacteriota archaeon]
MSDGSRETTARRLHDLLETEGSAVRDATTTFNAGRYDSLRELDDPDEIRARARAIKEDAIERLPALLDELTEAVESNGGHVHLASDADEANHAVRSILRAHDAVVVVKSKSMTTEEIDLNEAIEADGVDVWETDLGEFIVQLADESPSHITAPAIHRSQAAIAELFETHFDLDQPLQDAESLTRFARAVLTEHITAADVGITGANFIAADSGTIALVTSEGNARKCVATPPVHVAVAGVEKVIPSVADLEPFIELLARSAIGQDVSAYLSLFTPPVETPVPAFDAPDEPIDAGETEREFHLVLLDNGRFDLRDDDDLRETLYCIRCSACANSCANFQHVGGHAFGGESYSGGIATGWETGVHGIESAATFNDLCTGCTRCAPNCPVEIDIPWINTVVRDRLNREGSTGWASSIYHGLRPDESGGVTLQQRAVANVDRALAVANRLAPASTAIAETRPVRAMLDRVLGIDRRRALPTVSDERFTTWASRRRAEPEDDPPVVFYPDIYTEYIRP